MKKLLSLALVCVLLTALSVPSLAVTRDFASVKVNAIMASSGDCLRDSAGESPDWIELKNESDEDIDLSGLCLSDGKKNLEKYVFGDVTIPAHGYLVVFASGTEEVVKGEIHVGFKLSATGEKVVISYQGVILDSISFDEQEKDVSMARVDERNWKYTSLPTPGAENAFED